MRRLAPTLVLLAALLLPGSPAFAAQPRASLTEIEMNVMCTSCREPLAVAQSPQAQSERAYIRGLIAQGMTEKQIDAALVAQYGTAVLGRPPAQGFNLTVYILPPALVALGAVFLGLALPRWRRRARAARAEAPDGPAPLPPTDAARLDAELAGFDR